MQKKEKNKSEQASVSAFKYIINQIDRQIVLKTLVLKAMREAHAMRSDNILRRLNQLCTAGKLKFLEQLPVVKRSPAYLGGACCGTCACTSCFGA